MKKILTLMTVLTFALGQVCAARIDTLMVRSEKMDRSIQVVAVMPQVTAESNGDISRFPVLYLLHGYSGDCFSWLKINRQLPQMADRDGIIIVCPDGENSWYWDSPTQKDSQFETFVSKELVEYIDHHYPTIASREGRAITGLSMGGHGALWLSIRHKETFGACGSTSGGADIRPFPNNWEMKKQLGELKDNTEMWDRHTVMTQLDKIQNKDLAIIIDCGTSDFFYKVNVKLHKELEKRGIFHDFISRPGIHNSIYWRNSIEYQWLFFNKFFNGYRTRIK